VGEEGLSNSDRSYLDFASAFERDLICQDGSRTFEESMQAGWTALRRLPRSELTRLSDAQIALHLGAAQ
jgi:V/A-type H+-transporting ATPase subunit B